MSKPYDVTTKQLVEAQPSAWVRYAGLPVGETEIIDSDLATVSTEADRILRVNSANPYLAHIEFQVTYKADLPDRTLRYNVLIYYRHKLPVQSVIFLMRPQADGPAKTGRVDYSTATDDGSLEIIHRMEARIQQEANASEAEMLWMSTYLLMGLRYSEAFASELLKGVQALEESTTYQAIIAKGRVEGEFVGRAEEARSLLLILGRKRFGEPQADVVTAVQNITNIERLEQLAERLFEVESWQELFAE